MPAAPDDSARAIRPAPKPLFRDPGFDGAADPVVVWNARTRRWCLFYTNRRATLATDDPRDLRWFHGTRIGWAESSDGGATWTHGGTLDLPVGPADYTHWAPEIVAHDGLYHMYLTVVPGTFTDWNHPRRIVHLTSPDLRQWREGSTLALSSDRVIDACVLRLDDGTWRLWYNDERDNKAIYHAASADLHTWHDLGRATGVGDQPGEGPKVFRWRGGFWMIVDVWQGLAVYRSPDARSWQRQPRNLVGPPVVARDSTDVGRHADVVVNQDRAYLFYFSHPQQTGADVRARARSALHVAELQEAGGELHCDRDAEVQLDLRPPSSG